MVDEKAREEALRSVPPHEQLVASLAIGVYEQARQANVAPSQDRVEVAAKAMSRWMNGKKLPAPPNWDRLQESTRQAYRDQAQTALAALPQPVEVSEAEFLKAITIVEHEKPAMRQLYRSLPRHGYRIVKGEV